MRKSSLWGVFLLAGVASCSSDDAVSSDKDAEKAYTGLDRLVEVGIDLGFAGMNAATGANIPAQMATGLKTGTLTVAGKVDQGVSDNKNIDLTLGLVMFSDDGKVTYDTPTDTTAQPKLTLALKKLPSGTLTGTLAGDFAMKGDLEGNVTLMLSITGDMEPDSANTKNVRRKPGTTHITGTATSKAGTYDVDITK